MLSFFFYNSVSGFVFSFRYFTTYFHVVPLGKRLWNTFRAAKFRDIFLFVSIACPIFAPFIVISVCHYACWPSMGSVFWTDFSSKVKFSFSFCFKLFNIEPGMQSLHRAWLSLSRFGSSRGASVPFSNDLSSSWEKCTLQFGSRFVLVRTWSIDYFSFLTLAFFS